MGKSVLGNNALAGYNDLFSSTVDTQMAEPTNLSPTDSTNTTIDLINMYADADGERIVEIPLSELYPPEFHPFQVTDDEAMDRLAVNIKQYGVREPGFVRPRRDENGELIGGYELLCGNRRKRACELAGRETLPVIIRELSDDEAVLAMVDSNLEQREKLLFSERAWAYRVKMEALNHRGVKSETHSIDVLVEQTGESRNQIFRLIRLTELVCALLDRVDTKQLAFTPAVELSYLSQTEQTAVAEAMDKYEIKPSLSQAKRLRRLKQVGELTVKVIDKILSEIKKPIEPKSKPIGLTRLIEFFPSDYTHEQIEEAIIKILINTNAVVA